MITNSVSFHPWGRRASAPLGRGQGYRPFVSDPPKCKKVPERKKLNGSSRFPQPCEVATRGDPLSAGSDALIECVHRHLSLASEDGFLHLLPLLLGNLEEMVSLLVDVGIDLEVVRGGLSCELLA